MKYFKTISLGCRVNQYETAWLDEQLTSKGMLYEEDIKKADAVIINTCYVTASAANQCRQVIRKVIREAPDAKVTVTGCYAQIEPEALKAIKGIALIAGNSLKHNVPELIFEKTPKSGCSVLTQPFSPDFSFKEMPIKIFPGRTRAMVKIQDGCESKCSYCIVPKARGPYRSLPCNDILTILSSIADNGIKEVVLTGIHLGMYGPDINSSLPGLLKLIGKSGFPFRIRLSSIEPTEITRELIELVAHEPWLCRHFHIPLQSGDNNILLNMNRRYTVSEYEKIIFLIRDEIPLAGIGVDVMTGFPGESEAAHANTLNFIEDMPISYLHVFPFSPRPFTAAEKMDNKVPLDIKKKRSAQLRALGEKKRSGFFKDSIGHCFNVVSEGSKHSVMAKGFSDTYLPVRFKAATGSEGSLFNVHIEQAAKFWVEGTIKK